MSKKFLYPQDTGYEKEAEAFETSDFIDSSTGAADAGKPVKLDGDGNIDASMINDSDVSHDSTDGAAASTVHTAFSMLDGSRDYTAIVGYDSHKSFASDTDIVDKKYVDDEIAAAVTGSAAWKEVCLHDDQFQDGSANSDGILPAGAIYFSAQPSVGDTVIVSFDGGTTTRIYTFVANQGAESAATDVSIETSAITAMQRLVTRMNADASRISDAVFEADALDSINADGVVVLLLKDGSDIPTAADQSGVYGSWTTQASFQVVDFEDNKYESSTGANAPTSFDANFGFGRRSSALASNEAHPIRSNNKLAVWNDDQDTWTKISAPGAYTASLGVEIVSENIQANLKASGGIKLDGNEMEIEPNDFAGEGLKDDGTDNMAIDWSTSYDDSKAVKASDLNSTDNGKGASIIGIEDTGGYTSETDVEGALQEIYSLMDTGGVEYTVGAGGCSKGDLLYISANDTVLPYSTITVAQKCIGIADADRTVGQTVRALSNDTVLTGILTTATAGTIYFWNGSGWQTTIPATSGAYIYIGGVAKNATDAHVEVSFYKQNS